jgi:predicted AlkP superfamily pyrophosphatase or phosphodiesterase
MTLVPRGPRRGRRRSRRLAGALLLPVLAGVGGCVRERPALGVLIVVDGLRGDLLRVYDSRFTGGFRRFTDAGFRYRNAMVDHAITVSHAGHVTIATGSNPARHGIVDAAYYVPGPGASRHLVDALQDSAEHIVGDSSGRPAVSPRRVLVEGIAEWLRDRYPDSRVVAVGSGAYSSVLHVYRAPADVYWFDPGLGRYVTSTFYRKTDAPWVAAFNRSVPPSLRDSSLDWRPVAGQASAPFRPDAYRYEADGVHTALPHEFSQEVSPAGRASPAAQWRWFANTPWEDDATLRLAESAIRDLDLGHHATPDYLAIVLSQSDNASHYYGPMSDEELDVLLRMDRWLGAFLDSLDQRVGRGRWVAALTSDHGMANLPEYEAEHGRPGRRLTEPVIEAVERRVAAEERKGSSPAGIAALLSQYGFVAQVYDSQTLASPGRPSDLYLRLYRNSYRPGRVPRLPLFRLDDGTSAIAAAGLMVRLRRGTIVDIDRATHGSPYAYDRRVPLMFLGAGVPHGVSDAPARTVDVAPTLARLLGIPVPVPINGRSLFEPR